MIGAFDIQHLQSIHRYIFQDVYAWAGNFRTVNIARSGQFFFAFHEQIVTCLDKLFRGLAGERHLAGPDRIQFCSRAAYYMGEVNATHPFREGNGRTQREFIRELAVRNGHTLNWSCISREQMIEASRRSFHTGDNTGLEELLRFALGDSRN